MNKRILKIIAVILAMLMILSTASCGTTSPPLNSENDELDTSVNVSTNEVIITTDETTESDTNSDTDVSTDDSSSETEKDTDDDSDILFDELDESDEDLFDSDLAEENLDNDEDLI